MTKTLHHRRDILARETAHFAGPQRVQLAAMIADAAEFAARCPHAPPEAISVKLMTLHENAPRWLRQLVALAALEAVAAPLAA